MKHLLKTTILEPLMAHHLIMVLMNANTTRQKILPKTYTPLIIHYHYFTRSDTDDGRGGVGLFINSNFTYVKRDDLSVFIPHVIESVFFEIQINERKTIIVGVVYRPNTQPRADIDIFMQKIIEIQSKIKEEIKYPTLREILILIY